MVFSRKSFNWWLADWFNSWSATFELELKMMVWADRNSRKNYEQFESVGLKRVKFDGDSSLDDHIRTFTFFESHWKFRWPMRAFNLKASDQKTDLWPRPLAKGPAFLSEDECEMNEMEWTFSFYILENRRSPIGLIGLIDINRTCAKRVLLHASWVALVLA